MKKSTVAAAALLLLAVAIVSAKVSAQAPQSSSNNDVNAALVRELHDLRLAIEKLASSNSRVQILSNRASQGDQRISNLMTQMIAMNSRLADAASRVAHGSSTLEALKERLRIETDPKGRDMLVDQIRELTFEFDQARLAQNSIQAQAEAIRQQMTLEQSNLADLQRRLDDLDRSMEPRQ